VVDRSALFLMTLGALLAVGLASDFIGRRTRLPRVTLLLLFGLLIGPSGLALIPDFLIRQFDLVADMALVMVGFLLGEKLTLPQLRQEGREILAISASAAAGTSIFVVGALLLAGTPLALALVLGGIAAATAPAATLDIVEQFGGRSRFSRLLLAVVALDDAWGLIVFSLCIALATASEVAVFDGGLLLRAAVDVFGAAAVGLAVGFPGALLSGRIQDGRPILTEALAMVFLCGGIALALDVSFIVAAMTMGATVANVARHHDRPFNAIETVDWPLMILFFVLAGASLHLDAVLAAGTLGAVYVVARATGKLAGGWLGARIAGSDAETARWIGPALMPQAGVAIGMALVAANQLPEYEDQILAVAIGSTVLFELLGPLATRAALRRLG
jgi:Kef-type K+ transport system membrane component KefB